MRSIVVSPSAINPAITRQAEARRSVAITLAPVSAGTPFTIAVLFSKGSLVPVFTAHWRPTFNALQPYVRQKLFPSERMLLIMYAYCGSHLAEERSEKDTEEQFIYKTRKKLWGPFKEQVWTLPESTRAAIRAQLEEKLDFLYEKLGVIDSRSLVERYVANPPRITKPQPSAMQAAAMV